MAQWGHQALHLIESRGRSDLDTTTSLVDLPYYPSLSDPIDDICASSSHPAYQGRDRGGRSDRRGES
jgi:hypothetical protein